MSCEQYEYHTPYFYISSAMISAFRKMIVDVIIFADFVHTTNLGAIYKESVIFVVQKINADFAVMYGCVCRGGVAWFVMNLLFASHLT